jgi:hypothetical protein
MVTLRRPQQRDGRRPEPSTEDLLRQSEAYPGAHYYPPWCDDGRMYGPRSVSGYERAVGEWEQSRAAGGLWDDEEDTRMRHPVRQAVEDADSQRADAEHMADYVALHSSRIPTRELEVYYRHYRDGSSTRQIARDMGVRRESVRTWLRRLRHRARPRPRLSPGRQNLG